tara:strand:+ start:1420 stop:2067 length:648 start_codon:yes stop_codon:yes gene_type:complete
MYTPSPQRSTLNRNKRNTIPRIGLVTPTLNSKSIYKNALQQINKLRNQTLIKEYPGGTTSYMFEHKNHNNAININLITKVARSNAKNANNLNSHLLILNQELTQAIRASNEGYGPKVYKNMSKIVETNEVGRNKYFLVLTMKKMTPLVKSNVRTNFSKFKNYNKTALANLEDRLDSAGLNYQTNFHPGQIVKNNDGKYFLIDYGRISHLPPRKLF